MVPPEGFDPIYDLYYVPWARIQPYLVGMLLGFGMWKLKGQKVNIPWVTRDMSAHLRSL